MTMVNYITWNKRRGYGTHRNYLFTREELAYFVKGKENLPRVFNIPLTSIERGYAGFNEKYPAKSKYLRRTNVWTIPELFRGKYHSCQKPLEVMQIPIETSSRKNDWILDMFAGSGATGFAARNAGRKFILIEQDPEHYNNIVQRMKIFKPGDKL
jgi:DNA modification methylase